MAEGILGGCRRNPTHPPRDAVHLRALGQLKMKDLLEDCGTEKHTSLLLLRAGNIQDVLMTIAGVSRRHKGDALTNRSLEFHVNDNDITVQARNILLLEMMTQLDVVKTEDMEFLWSIWINVKISTEHQRRLRYFLNILSAATDMTSSFSTIGKSEDAKRIEDIMKKWATFDHNVDSVMESRKVTRQNPAKIIVSALDNIGLELVDPYFFREYEETGFMFPTTRVTENQATKVNPTMLRAASNTWCQTKNFQPLNAFLPVNREISQESLSTHIRTCYTKLVKAVQHFKETLKLCKVNIVFHVEEAMQVMMSDTLRGRRFDFIDTGTLVDDEGLSSVVLQWTPKLNSERSVLRVTSTQWGLWSESVDEFITSSLGCPALMIPTLYGLRLTENLDLGTSMRPSINQSFRGGHDSQSVLFMPCVGVQQPQLVLNDQGNIRDCIRHLVLCSMPWRVSQDGSSVYLPERALCSSDPVSLTTLLLCLARLQHSLKGGWPELIREVLSTMRDEGIEDIYSLAWNAVTAATGQTRGPDSCVIVQAPIQLQELLQDKEPKIAALVISEATDLDEPEADIAIGFEKSRPKFHIVPSFNLSSEDKVAHFPMLENEYNRIRSHSTIHMICARRMFDSDEMETRICEETSSKVAFSDVTKGELAQWVLAKPLPAPASDVDACIQEIGVVEKDESYEVNIKVRNNEQPILVEHEFDPPRTPTKITLKIKVGEDGQSVDVVLSFTCSVMPGKTTIQISKRRGLVIVKTTKCPFFNNSTLPLNKPRLLETSLRQIARPNKSEPYFKTIQKQVIFSNLGEQDLEASRSLRAFLMSLFDSFFDDSRHEVRVVHLMSEDGKDLMRLTLSRPYLYKGMWLYRVDVYINDVAERLVEEGKISGRCERPMHLEADLRNMNFAGLVMKDDKILLSHELLKKLLWLNSHQVEQHGPGLGDSVHNSWNYNSYIQLGFSRRKMDRDFVGRLRRMRQDNLRTMFVLHQIVRLWVALHLLLSTSQI